jgi:uncharacterized protein YkwD
MIRIFSLLLVALVTLAACESVGTSPQLDANGKPLPKVYKIRAGDTSKIEFRMLDSVNALREVAGAGPLQFNAALNAAAATHSRDMSVQNRPWDFGSDGSSPLTRVQRAGYTGSLVGEVISESYETELETLAAWMDKPDSRDLLMNPKTTDMGFSWYQENNGKIWWTLVVGTSPQTTPEA